MPVMKVDGTNTAQSTSAIEISAVPTSSIVRRDASRGESPAAMLRSTFSTTTMASSTTMPMASTSPNSERALMENPKSFMTAKVPTKETGTATMGMIEPRQRLEERDHHLLDGGAHESGRVVDDAVGEALGKALRELRHGLADRIGE